MNRFKLNAARKSEKAKGLMTNDNPALKSTKSINKQPMNRAGSVDLTPIMPKLQQQIVDCAPQSNSRQAAMAQTRNTNNEHMETGESVEQ